MVKKFLFFFLSRKGERGCAFAVFLAPFPEKGILDYIAHRPIIQVFTVFDAEVRFTVRVLCSGVERLKWRHYVCIMWRDRS